MGSRITTCLFSVLFAASSIGHEDLSSNSAACNLKIAGRSGVLSGTAGLSSCTLSSIPLLADAFHEARHSLSHRCACQGDKHQIDI